MDKREYLRVIKYGNCYELFRAVLFYCDYRLTFQKVDAKLKARAATEMKPKSKNKPAWFFGPRFFAKLSFMPAVSIDVQESRNQIRKTCYGFRETSSGVRVYLRIDPGSLVEFRDSPCGILTGTRYLIPGIDRMKSHRWDKVERKIGRILKSKGIIVTRAMVQKQTRSHRMRTSLSERIIIVRTKYLRTPRKKYETTPKPVPEQSGVLRYSDARRLARSKSKRRGVRRARSKPRDSV